jgi:oligoribonuclease
MTGREAAFSAENLVWIDLEMTGLDPSSHAILQAALVITTANLQPLDDVAFDVWQSDDVLERMVPVVREMHARTGLIERVRRSKLRLSDVERLLLDRISRWCPAPATLCGNSIWTDRRFLERQMPDLDRYFHYRLVDVSSIKVMAQRWYGEAAVFAKPKDGEHDARVDVRNSIAELRHYRETLFRTVDMRVHLNATQSG